MRLRWQHRLAAYTRSVRWHTIHVSFFPILATLVVGTGCKTHSSSAAQEATATGHRPASYLDALDSSDAALCTENPFGFDCIEAREETALAQNALSVHRAGSSLEIDLASGEVLQMHDSVLAEDATWYYKYLGIVPRLGHHLLLRTGYELFEYRLVDSVTGAIFNIDGEPLVSPFENKFATHTFEVVPEDLSRVQVWRWDTVQAILEWNWDGRLSDCEGRSAVWMIDALEWSAPSTIRLSLSPLDDGSSQQERVARRSPVGHWEFDSISCAT